MKKVTAPFDSCDDRVTCRVICICWSLCFEENLPVFINAQHWQLLRACVWGWDAKPVDREQSVAEKRRHGGASPERGWCGGVP